MPPTGASLGGNRFSLLMESPNRKRKKSKPLPKESFPLLPTVKRNNPKFLVANTLDTKKPLNRYSCFAVHKALKGISSEIDNISELKDGSLLLLVKNDIVANKFLSTKKLADICDINFELHKNLNSVKGTIYAPCLNYVSEKEIIENLKDQGVSDVYKFLKHKDGKTNPSGVLLLTFDRYYLPEKIEVSWYTTKVRPYYPNPMRCKSCQLLGHTYKRCDKTPACDNCSLPPHSPTPCSRTLCANCFGNHPSSSKTCPKFTQMKQILTIKTDNKCTMREAIHIHKQQIPQLNPNSSSFADTVKEKTKSQTTQQQNIVSENTSDLENINENSENEIHNIENNKAIVNNNSTTNTLINAQTTNAVDDSVPNGTSVSDFISQLQFIPSDFVPQISNFLSTSSSVPNPTMDTQNLMP
uniref:Nucleic-acid-binding protein from transposon X-element n=1 Tax=Ceratitis capitata TaxID=7213 RepID=W8B1Q6_CERCA